MNAVPFSPKNFNEVKKSIGCIIARRSKKGVLSVLSPIGRYTWFLNINDWAALPLVDAEIYHSTYVIQRDNGQSMRREEMFIESDYIIRIWQNGLFSLWLYFPK